MGSTEFLCLRWNEFESNIKNVFAGLRKDEEFFDVTLACGSQQIKAHKVILSSFSPTLRSIIKSVPHQHPLLYMRSIQFNHLESLISFMYNGEVNVPQEDLDDFLAVAEELKVRGLVQGTPQQGQTRKRPNTLSGGATIEPKTSRNTTHNRLSVPSQSSHPPTSAEESELEDGSSAVESATKYNAEDPMIVNLDPDELGDDAFTHEVKNEEEYEDYGTELQELSSTEDNSLMDTDLLIPESSRSHQTPNRNKDLLDVRIMKFASSQRNDKGNFKCLKCSYETPRLMDLKRHIESKHFVTDGFPCETCGFRSKTRYGLYRHRTRNHRMDPEYFSTI